MAPAPTRPAGLLAQLAHVDSLTPERRRAILDGVCDTSVWLGPAGKLVYSDDGLAGYLWPAQQQPRALVILVHGQGSYAVFDYLRFNGVGKPKSYAGSWVEALNRAGFAVAALDNRGCGRSAGLFAYVTPSWRTWPADLLAFVGRVQAAPGFGGLPTFLLGASLGGWMALEASLAAPGRFAGLVLLAPMVSLEGIKRRGWNPLLTRVAALLNYVVPTWPLVKTGQVNTMFPLLQQDFDTDGVTYHYDTRVRVGVECLRACEHLCANLGRVDAPLLVFHSQQDTMTDPAGSQLLVDRVGSADKALRLLQGRWHVLTKEDGHEAILAECIDWMRQRTLPKGLHTNPKGIPRDCTP